MFFPKRLIYKNSEGTELHSEGTPETGSFETTKPLDVQAVDLMKAIQARTEVIQGSNNEKELNNRSELHQNAFTKLAIKNLELSGKFPTIASYQSEASVEEQQNVQEVVSTYKTRFEAFMEAGGNKEALQIMRRYQSIGEGERIQSIGDALNQIKDVHNNFLNDDPSEASIALSEMLYDRIAMGLIFPDDDAKAEFAQSGLNGLNMEDKAALRSISDVMLEGVAKKRILSILEEL